MVCLSLTHWREADETAKPPRCSALALIALSGIERRAARSEGDGAATLEMEDLLRSPRHISTPNDILRFQFMISTSQRADLTSQASRSWPGPNARSPEPGAGAGRAAKGRRGWVHCIALRCTAVTHDESELLQFSGGKGGRGKGGRGGMEGHMRKSAVTRVNLHGFSLHVFLSLLLP